MGRQRLDQLLHERGLAPSREKARTLIMAGEVLVNGQVVDKPGMRVDGAATLTVKARARFASRGGEKLDAALRTFGVDVTGRVCADVGASTGGFTDCLLQHGAARVYALDVGYGQLDYRLRQDARVVVMERINARYVERLPEAVALVAVDASFISLGLLLPPIRGWLAPRADVIPLVKPQFEAGKQDVGKGGVVKDARVHTRVLEEVLKLARQLGYTTLGLVRSPITGPAGNVEFLAWLGWGYDASDAADIAALIRGVMPQ